MAASDDHSPDETRSWWQHWQVVVVLVVAAFAAGTAAGTVLGVTVSDEDGAEEAADEPLSLGPEERLQLPDDIGVESVLEQYEQYVDNAGTGADATVELPEATLTVHSDGCGVIRSEFDEDPDGLTWSVSDADGFEVLGRNVLGETHYRYFQRGTYTVVLEAWDGDRYAPISNTVTIHC